MANTPPAIDRDTDLPARIVGDLADRLGQLRRDDAIFGDLAIVQPGQKMTLARLEPRSVTVNVQKNVLLSEASDVEYTG